MAKGFFRTAVFALLFAGLAAGASAQMTVSGGFALSSVKGVEVSGQNMPVEGGVGIGGNVYFDYLLPLSIPLSLGLEVGVDGGSFTFGQSPQTTEDKITAIPILLRAAYHFDLFPKLDLYLVGKLGAAFGIWTGEQRDFLKNNSATVDTIGGVAFGIDAGVAYYFSPRIGIFGEVGFDDYMLKTKISSQGSSETLKAPFGRFLTIGLSTKF
ncbi:MAG: outer membrane beta-barrel protein [Treponema sp.]|jgi:opacity protein-like surface antigen|nr:outer membrane beta-barrel protein [Treponema sp.]